MIRYQSSCACSERQEQTQPQRNSLLSKALGVLQERAPAPQLHRKFDFLRICFGRGTAQLLRDAGALGVALLLPNRPRELSETQEGSHGCCWRKMPGHSQPQFLGLAPPPSAFNLKFFPNNQSNPPVLPKRYLASSREVKMSVQTHLMPAEFGCRSNL